MLSGFPINIYLAFLWNMIFRWPSTVEDHRVRPVLWFDKGTQVPSFLFYCLLEKQGLHESMASWAMLILKTLSTGSGLKSGAAKDSENCKLSIPRYLFFWNINGLGSDGDAIIWHPEKQACIVEFILTTCVLQCKTTTLLFRWSWGKSECKKTFLKTLIEISFPCKVSLAYD